MKKCADIVVTYNRKKMLKENIKALLSQDYFNHDIIVIDNASTDGTEELVKEFKDDRIKYYNTGKNIGGAGGFSFGLKKVFESEVKYDYAWIMDDDAIPNKNALSSLINKAKTIKNRFSFLASLVYWTDGSLCNMNYPSIKYNNVKELRLDLISQNKIIPIMSSSFVGCFVNLNIAKTIGLPISEFFIYGDDTEYTTRLRNQEKGYLDLESVIIHKAPSNNGADLVNETYERLFRYYYQYRNTVYIYRKNNMMFKMLLKVIKMIIKILLKSPNFKFKRICVLLKGSISGLFFNPKIEYVNVKKEKDVSKEVEDEI